MYFQDVASLLHMEGHGLYVWSAYGTGLLILTYNVLVPLWHRKQVVHQIRRQICTFKQVPHMNKNGAKQSRSVDSKGRLIKSQQRISAEDRKE